MRVLVTGATGFVGSHSVKALVEAGHEVRLLVRSPDAIASALDPLGVSGVDHCIGDVTDSGSVETAIRGCDAVLHAAGVFTLDARRHAEMEAVNLGGARNVLGTAVRLGLDPIIHVSSLMALFPPVHPVFDVDSPVGTPLGPYGRTKAECEREARSLQERGAPVVITYPGNVWGPCDPKRGESMQILGRFLAFGGAPDPGCGGLPVVDVRDLAAVHASALVPGQGPRRYLCGGHLLQVREVFDVLRMATGRRLVVAPVRPGLLRGLGRVVDRVRSLTGVDLLLSHEAMDILTRMVPTDDSQTTHDLGVTFRRSELTLRDALAWMYDQGLLKARHVGSLATA
ncbi:NAD-dependent epimerase/dehydratase family protein [Myxococcota bacterium]|nr:NAD-dependent epimerase/dehydratase family protein [Myxococcota bacterium]